MDQRGEVEDLLARYPKTMREAIRPAAEVAARVVGMAEGDAKEIAKGRGVFVQTMDADNPSATTMELVSNRLTFWVRQGLVVKVEIG